MGLELKLGCCALVCVFAGETQDIHLLSNMYITVAAADGQHWHWLATWPVRRDIPALYLELTPFQQHQVKH
jgi:hypothetical protein